jgi:hypothetical protein
MKSKYKSIIEEEVAIQLKDVRSKVRKLIEGSLLSLLGLQKDYQGRTEIDHCNGRNSVLIDVFRQIAVDEVTKIANGYKPNKEELDVFRAEFKREIKNQMSYKIRDAAQEKAGILVRNIMEDIKIDVDKILEEKIK